MSWRPIETAPTQHRKVFLAIRIDIRCPNYLPYTTDPWCVWWQSDGSLARWPHPFPPTHWAEIPSTSDISE